MLRRLCSLALLTVLLVVGTASLALAADVPVPPFDTSAKCLGCHGVTSTGALSKVDFDVPPTVSLEKCKACHAKLPDLVTYASTLTPSHYHTGNSCSGCHNGDDAFYFAPGAPRLMVTQPVGTSYGYFVRVQSLAALPIDLHRIHSGKGWVAQLFATQLTGAGDGSTYMKSTIGIACASCHAAAACNACHSDTIAHGTHGTTAYDPPTTRRADGTSVLTTPSACINDACHSLANAGTTGFTPTCQGCHPSNTQTHGYDAVDHVADDGSTIGIACSACHALDLATEHEKPTSSSVGRQCATCHPSPRNSLGAWDQSCATGGCHTVLSSAPMHSGLPAAHALPAVAAECTSCHPATDLASLHTGAVSGGRTSCLVCHTGSVPTNDCTTCHFTFEQHYDSTAHTSTWDLLACGGTGCHATNDLMPEHQRAAAVRGASFECATCHRNAGPDAARYNAAIAAGDTACDACHPGVSPTSGHREVHGAAPPLVDATGAPQYSYYTGSVGTAPTSDCLMCHTGNLVDEHMGVSGARPVRTDADGTALDCATCHRSAKIEVLSAIASGTTACEACHEVHGPIWATHSSTFTPAGDEGCSGCHTPNLDGAHSGLSTTLPSGKVLTGCALCHDNTEGERGAAVQTAIDVTNDTRCTACHAAYHAAASARHTADSPASVDGCGSCHDDGGAAGLDVTAVHSAVTTPGPCAVCHANPTRVPDLSAKTAECSSCHATPGSDYHAALPAAHTYAGMSPACVGSGCHAATTLPEVHQPYLSRYPGYKDTCALCHKNVDPSRIDWTSANADCSTCHTVHGDIAEIHTAAKPAGCFTCHKSADVRQIHADSPEASCVVCHNANLDLTGKTTDCDSCHTAEKVDFHQNMDVRHQGLTGTSGCDVAECHASVYVPQIHARFVGTGKQYSQYPDSCALCHLNQDADRIDWDVATNGTCRNCHAYPQHQGSNHRATSAESSECVACHGSDWVPIVHDPSQQWEQCNVCHDNPTKGDLTWDKTDSDCEQCHSLYPAAQKHYPTTSHAAAEATGCSTCHSMDLASEHAKTTSGSISCVGCHTSTLFSALDKPWDGTCAACHTSKHGGLPGKHTATTSTACERCHDRDNTAGMNVEQVHAASPKGECAVCHANSSRVPDITAKTAECGACHAVSGSDYHSTMSAQHTFSAMPSSCVGAGCHASKSLPEAHTPYLNRYPEYEDTCALCHLNAAADRVDWTQASADCSSCHTVHGDIAVIHAAPSSTECVACHESADVRVVHGATPEASCSVCHNGTIDLTGKTTRCTDCHALSPADTRHYPAPSHLASAETGCTKCHSMDMKTEHVKPTVAVSCVQCHETKVDSFTAAWDKSCSACHPTKHGQMQAKHVSSRTECSGAGCHVITDASDLHKGVPGGGCGVCHDAGARLTTDCTVCHSGVGTNHHEQHNALVANPGGCNGCHKMYLDDEHASLGYACATCHDSARADVSAAITAGDRTCAACHPAAHDAQASEFNAGNGSMHRTSSDLPGMQSSFRVGTATYTWPLPVAASFLKTGWTTSSIVTCDGCHTFAATPAGPHGSSVLVNIDPSYPVDWKTAYLTNSSSGMSSSSIICAKCHDLNGTNGTWSNQVHREGDHQGSSDGKCTLCHVQIPHGWYRPRLLGYTTDPAPYATTGLVQLKASSHTPTSWSESDCRTSCGEHDSSVTPVWPGVPAVTGAIAGQVTDAASRAPLSGVTVTAGGASTSTASDGTYSLAGVPIGATTVLFAKTGYVDLQQSVTVVKGANTLNAGLVATSNLALGMPFTASRYEGSTYLPNKAGDGDEATYWWSNRSGGSTTVDWLRVDLGASRTISRVEVAWYASYYAREFRVYTSTDGSYWTQVYSTTSGVAGTTNVTFAARAARYVKVECRRTGTGRSNGYSISELRVFQ